MRKDRMHSTPQNVRNDPSAEGRSRILCSYFKMR